MIIKQHHFIGEQLQRSIVDVDGTLHRRIAILVKPLTGEVDKVLPEAIWQHQIHTGEFHNIVTKDRHGVLEAEFIRLLIEANKPAGCTCAAGHEAHPCPYAEEIQGQSGDACNCCPHCTGNCANEI